MYWGCDVFFLNLMPTASVPLLRFLSKCIICLVSFERASLSCYRDLLYIKRKHACVWCHLLWEVTQRTFSDMQIYFFFFSYIHIGNLETRLSSCGSNHSSMRLQRTEKIELCTNALCSLSQLPNAALHLSCTNSFLTRLFKPFCVHRAPTR